MNAYFANSMKQRLAEKLDPYLRRKSYVWDDVQVDFIVSTGRTGTMFLAGLISDVVADVVARHEPTPDLFMLAAAATRGELSPARIRRQLLRARAPLRRELRQADCRHYVESNPNVGFLLPTVRACFPQARIVHVVRDGRDVVRSWYQKRVHDRQGGQDALFLSPEDVRPRIQACDFPRDPYHDRWSSMSRFEQLCWHWANVDRFVADALANDPRALRVPFEEIFDRDRGHVGLFDILRFLDLEDRLTVSREDLFERMTRKANASSEPGIGPWEAWPAEFRDSFREIAGEQMERCGYRLD